MSDTYDGIIDIYHGDAVDSFHAVQSAGIGYVIVKAGQGTAMVDPQFNNYITRAATVGCMVGSYWFGAGGDGAAQADKYLSVASPSPGELVCLDWETPKMSLASAAHFVEHIHTALGRWPVLYSGQSFLQERIQAILDSSLSQCPLWVARYNPDEPMLRGWKLWQVCGDGVGRKPYTVPGIQGFVDRSVFKGSEQELRSWWGT